MRKVALFLVFIIAFIALPFSYSHAQVITGFSTVQIVGIPGDDFIGSISLSEANLYEKDFNSEYMFPMQGICSVDDGHIAVIDNSYGRVHILNSVLGNELTFGNFNRFSYPTDIAFYNGKFYITDPLKDEVIVYGKNGTYIVSFGKNTFTSPIGVAVSENGIYISDYFKNKIYLLGFDYRVKQSVPIPYPGGLTVKNDRLYAVSMSQRKVYVFDANLKQITSFGSPEVIFPSDVSVDKSGNIYIVDRGLSQGQDSKGRVLKFSASYKYLYAIGTPAASYPGQKNGEFLTPCGVAVLGNDVFVMDAGYYYWDSNSEAPFGSSIGSRLTEMTDTGVFVAKKDFKKRDGTLVNPLGATLDGKGNLWVADYGGMEGGELVEFSSSGEFVKRITEVNGSELPAIYSVYSDKKGHIFVGAEKSILVFGESGVFLYRSKDPAFSEVRKIIRGKNGNFYATSMDDSKVVEFSFSPDSSNMIKVKSVFSVCSYPSGIAQAPDGNFYITSVDDNKVHIYDTDFKEIGTIGAGGGRGKMNFYVPDDVGVDKFGNIIVADTENGRLTVFDRGGNLVYQSLRDFYEVSSIEIEDGMLIATDCFHNVIRILSEEAKVETHAFFASVYPAKQIVRPGEEANFVINISNAGAQRDTYQIFVKKDFPPNWHVSLQKDSVSLSGGEAAEVGLKVVPPVSAKDGDSVKLSIVVSSPRKSTNFTVVVTVSTKLPPKLVVKSNDIMLSQSGIVEVYVEGLRNVSGVSFVMHIPDNIYIRSIEVGSLFKESVLVKRIIGDKIIMAVSSLDKEVVSGSGLVVRLEVGSVRVGKGTIEFNDAYCINIVGGKETFEIVSNPVVVSPLLVVNFNDGITSSSQNFSFTGRVSGAFTVYVNGQPVKLSSDGTFTATVVLASYKNIITITAKSKSGVSTTITRTVYYKGKKMIVIKLQIGNPIMTVNGVKMEIDPGRGTKPFIKEGWNRTLVPIRAIVESLGGTVGWEPKTRMVWIVFNSTEINMWIGKPQAKVNNILVWIDPSNHNVSPIIKNDRTFVPIRFVAENLGCTVLWDDATKTVTIIYEE